jgi:hypothetical protein
MYYYRTTHLCARSLSAMPTADSAPFSSSSLRFPPSSPAKACTTGSDISEATDALIAPSGSPPSPPSSTNSPPPAVAAAEGGIRKGPGKYPK